MFYSGSQNRHKRWYHILFVGHKKLWALGIFFAFILVACITFLGVYSVRASAYDMRLVCSGLQGSVLYDSDHRVVSMLSERENAPVQWEELPESLVQAFMAREDAHFFDHGGVVYSAILRSVLRNIISMRYKEGASTITMQLTRHVFELQGKTMDRKLLEIVLAQRMERHFDKQTILRQYLSRIYFGQNCYGVRDAARYYFGKAVSELNLPESAMLAGIVRAPSLYNPKRSPDNARKVRRETLLRMLELEMISQEQFEQADAVPLPDLSQSGTLTESATLSYPAMWANAELDACPEVQGELGKGVAAVSFLSLPLQQYMEMAVQKAVAAVETPGLYPDAWREERPEAQVRDFSTMRRPNWLCPPSADLPPGHGTVQCCALVLDARRNHRGHVLAVVGGRGANDGTDRWQTTIQPGRTIAPLIFCCACLPGGDAHHIVAHSARITASRLGYDIVRSLFDSLALQTPLPDREHENDLYDGLFPLRKLDLARLLFDLQNEGRGYTPTLVSAVWSHAQRLLYAAGGPETIPEYIRRESAGAVAHISPFLYHEGEPIILHETLPEQDGQWTMVFNDRGVAAFVWMGVEGSEVPPSKELTRLISHASLALAKELHTQARRQLRAQAATPATPAAKP